MRWLIVFSVVFVGCMASVPYDDFGVTADMAAEAARMVVQVRAQPKPEPKPDDAKCTNCNGTGKVGDGRVWVKCPVCDGTGKRK